MGKIKIDIKPVRVKSEPSITVYQISIRDNGKPRHATGAVWEEAFGSKELAKAFLQGLKAAFSFTELGPIEIPPIPE